MAARVSALDGDRGDGTVHASPPSRSRATPSSIRSSAFPCPVRRRRDARHGRTPRRDRWPLRRRARRRPDARAPVDAAASPLADALAAAVRVQRPCAGADPLPSSGASAGRPLDAPCRRAPAPRKSRAPAARHARRPPRPGRARGWRTLRLARVDERALSRRAPRRRHYRTHHPHDRSQSPARSSSAPRVSSPAA